MTAGAPAGSVELVVTEMSTDTLFGKVERSWRASPFEGQPVQHVRIVRAPDRGQLRTVITGTKTHRTVAYPSLKFRCARYGDAETEDLRLFDEEVRVDVVKSVSQPIRAEILVGDEWHVTIPDYLTLYADGRRAIVECKRDWSRFRTRKGARQSFLAEAAAAALGLEYERYVLAHAGDDVRRANVERVQAARFTPVESVDAILAAGAVANGPTALGALAAILSPDLVRGTRMAFALMVRRIVEIDLTTELGPRSECRRVPPIPADLLSITELGDLK